MMKHLKPYTLFENFKSDIIDTTHLQEELVDMLSYLSDDLYNIQVREEQHHAFDTSVEVIISKDGGKFDFWTYHYHDELTPFKLGDIKEYLTRVHGYMEKEEWHCYNFEIVTYDKLDKTLSRKLSGGSYHTPVTYKDDKFYSSMFAHLVHDEQYGGLIDDDQQILCVYAGFGKSMSNTKISEWDR